MRNNTPIDWNKPIKTRAGRGAFFTGIVKTGREDGYLVVVTNSDGKQEAQSYYPDGIWTVAPGWEANDLVNVPKSAFRNLYQNTETGKLQLGANQFETREKAVKASGNWPHLMLIATYEETPND